MNNWYILAVIPVFGVLVFVHELGHFLTAKWAGIRVEEFGLGFPPNIVGIRKRAQGGWDVLWFGRGRDSDASDTQNPFSGTSGGMSRATPSNTLYSLNLLPIGGFVRMPGESGEMTDTDGNYDPDTFAAKTAGKRIIVLCAGVAMNVLLAFVLFTIAYSLGEPVIPSVIGTVQANSPAAAGHILPGDKILAVNGQTVQSFDDMHTVVTNAIASDKSSNATVHIKLLIHHSSDPANKTVMTAIDARKHPGANQGAMGVVASSQVEYQHYPLWQAPLKGLTYTYTTMRTIIVTLGQMITGAIQPQLSGPVGIAQVTGSVAQSVPTYGWFPILSLTALLSVNIAITNILPFPALDGGRVVLVLIEILRGGKRLKPEREGLINFVGLAVLLLLLAAVTVNDVMHWGS